jgi:hypothetical protein
MAKKEQANVEKQEPEKKPAIVYRASAQGTTEKTFSFTVNETQSAFIKAHRKTINFSDTFRKYLDSIIETVGKEEQSKKQ